MEAYIYNADIYCEDCAETIKATLTGPDTGDSDDYPQGPYPDGGGEADYPQHCGHCGEFLENSLTDNGANYVSEAVANNGAPEVWREFYDYL